MNPQHGFVKLVVLLVIVLIILGYLGFNVESIVNTPAVKNNIKYVWGIAVSVWNTVLVKPVSFIWNKIIIGFFWNNIVGFVEKVQSPPPPAQSLLPTL